MTGYSCLNSAAFGCEFNGIGEDVQHGTFQSFLVSQTEQAVAQTGIMKGQSGMFHQLLCFDEYFVKQFPDIHRFLTAGRAGFDPVSIGHVADYPKHLKQSPVQPCHLLLREGICVQCNHGKQSICCGHDIGKGFPKLTGGQRHCLKLRLIRILFQNKHMVIPNTADRGTPFLAGCVQHQIQTAILKSGIFFLAGGKQCGYISTLGDHQCLGRRIDPNDFMILYAKTGMYHQIQHPQCVNFLSHRFSSLWD